MNNDKFTQTYLNLIYQNDQVITEKFGAENVAKAVHGVTNSFKNLKQGISRNAKNWKEQYKRVGAAADAENEKKNAKWDAESPAEYDDPKAQYEVGMKYVNGSDGFEQDIAKGVSYLQKAANNGHEEAKKVLKRISNKKVFKESSEDDFDDEEIITEKGGAETMANIVHGAKNLVKNVGKSIKRNAKNWKEQYKRTGAEADAANDKKNARRDLESKAEYGDKDAMYELGINLLNGEGDFDQDVAKGVNWLQKAAEEGHEEAKAILQKISKGKSSSKKKSQAKKPTSTPAKTQKDETSPAKTEDKADAEEAPADAQETKAPEAAPAKGKRYPKTLKRSRDFNARDKRHIIAKYMENEKSHQNIDEDLKRAFAKIESIKKKLAAGREITLEERRIIRSLKHII